MKTWLKAYGAAWLTIAVLDGLWLGIVARGFYQDEMGSLMADQVRIVPALLFYLAYPAGLVFLSQWPRPPTLQIAALRAGVLGLMAYGTYDLTNLATLQGWSLPLTVVDLVWGGVVSACSGVAAWWAARGATTKNTP